MGFEKEINLELKKKTKYCSFSKTSGKRRWFYILIMISDVGFGVYLT